MKLGINLGYFGLGSDRDNIAVAQEADRLGYATCWAAEVYGSDAATVLAYVAAKTERIDVGSAIFQIPARTPTMTAYGAPRPGAPLTDRGTPPCPLRSRRTSGCRRRRPRWRRPPTRPAARA